MAGKRSDAVSRSPKASCTPRHGRPGDAAQASNAGQPVDRCVGAPPSREARRAALPEASTCCTACWMERVASVMFGVC